MKSKIQVLSSLILGISCLLSAGSKADLCVTSSRGISFVAIYSDDSQVNSATSQALGQCQQSSITDNNECSANLACGDNIANPYPSNYAACLTSSHGISFQTYGSSVDINTQVNQVVSACQQTSVTDNNQCSADVICRDYYSISLPYPSGNATCRTYSHNIPFAVQGAANQIGATVNAVVAQCQQNSATDNNECTANVSCADSQYDNGGGSIDPNGQIECQTTSHNIEFEAEGLRSQVDQVTAQVLSQCQQNPVTDNNECSQNLSCH